MIATVVPQRLVSTCIPAWIRGFGHRLGHNMDLQVDLSLLFIYMLDLATLKTPKAQQIIFGILGIGHCL